MLRLRNPVARADIVQHEVTKRMDDLVAERTRHGAQVAPGLVTRVKCLDWSPGFWRGVVGMMTNGAAERFVIPEEFFAFLRFGSAGERKVSGRRLGGAQETRKGFNVVAERMVVVVRILGVNLILRVGNLVKL